MELHVFQLSISNPSTHMASKTCLKMPPNIPPPNIKETRLTFQTTVLRTMFDYWTEFVAFRKNFTDSQNELDEKELSQQLVSMETKYYHDNRKLKMVAEKKRLSKLLHEGKSKSEVQLKQQQQQQQANQKLIEREEEEEDNDLIK